MSLRSGKVLIVFLGVVILILALGFMFFTNKNNRENTAASVTPEPTSQPEATNEPAQISKPEMIIKNGVDYLAILHTTSGDIKIDLYEDKTPITVNNFVYLAKNNFYNNTIFHRVVDGFMIQGGDPTGTGTGGPGYKFDDESFEGTYTRGTVAMANSGPNTNGSQFFIMHQDYQLPPAYVIFGKVTSGMDVVDKIATAETSVSLGGENSKPVNPVKIDSVEVVED